MRRLVASLTAASVLVAVLAVPAAADGGVEGSTLIPPADQTAVKITDEIVFDGTVPAGTPFTATLHAVQLGGTVLESFDVTSRVTETDGDIDGSVIINCFYIPGCFDGDDALRASVAGYTLTLATASGSDTSPRLDLDEQDPFLLGYTLVDPSHVVVRFSEDVRDPEGDAPGDWQVDGQRTVTAVEGVGDTRTLTLLFPRDPEDTPEIRYLPLPSPVGQLPNVPYLDRAGNDLLADDRFALANDAIAPGQPTITSIEGVEVTYVDEDEAVAVLGNAPQATVVVEEVVVGTIVQLFLDDGDARFEPEQDTLVGEEPAGDGSVTIVTDDLGADRVLRLYARAIDQAECDPNDPDTELCPNPSERSPEARYDLETVPPVVGEVLARAGTISVPFSEPVFGAEDAGQWSVDNGAGPVVTITSVAGSGERRTLSFDGGPVLPGAELTWTRPAADGYADDHGNELASFVAPIGAADLPILEVVGTTVEEGTDGLLPADTTVTWDVTAFDVGPGETVTLDFATLDGTATDGPDYAGVTGSLALTNAGVTAATLTETVTVDLVADELDEFDEDLRLELSNVVGARLPANAATLEAPSTITDDDALVSVGFADASTTVSVDEGDTITLTVELGAVSGKAVSVDHEVVRDGTAGAADVPAQTGTVVIPAGSTSVTFDVATTADQVDEDDETFSVVLGEPSNATLLADRSTLTIVDDDVPLPVLSVTAGEVSEADGALPLLGGPEITYTFTLSSPPAQPLEVRWSTEGDGTAVAGQDYTAASGSVRFEAGETEATATVEVIPDELDEFDETVAVVVVDPAGAELSNGAETLTVFGTVLDDDLPVDLSLGDDVEVTEGDTAVVDVLLSAVSGKDVEVRFTTTDGTASAGSDYVARAGSLTIPAGQTSATIAVQTLDDAADEPDEEVTLAVEVLDDAATVVRPEATVSILDDDLVDVPPGTVAVSLSGGSVEEGDPFAAPVPTPGAQIPFTVQLSEPADEDVVLTYETRTGTATAGEDYEVLDGQSVTIAAGDTQAQVTVTVVPDSIDEPDETVVLAVTSATGGAVVPGGVLQRDGRILDDDPQALLRVDDVVVLEGQTAVVEVSLDAASGRDVVVGYSLVDGTADGDDHEGVDGVLRFPAGTTVRSVAVPTVADARDEDIETLTFELATPQGAGVEDGVGTITILDTDSPGAVVADGADTDEGDSGKHAVAVPITLTAAREGDTTISWQTQDGSAVAGEDYVDASGQVVIPEGETKTVVLVTVLGDEEVEVDEAFLVVVTDAGGAVIAGPTGRVVIADDDAFGLPDLPDLPEVPGEDGDGDGGDDPPGTDGDGELGAPDGGGGGGGGGGGLPATGGGALTAGLLALAAADALRRRRGRS